MCTIWRSLLCLSFGRRQNFAQIEDEKTDGRSKCDEKRPYCGNCINHDVECKYIVDESTAAPSPQTELSEPSFETRPRATRFKPYQYATGQLKQTFKLQKPKGSPNRSRVSIGTQCDISKETPTGSISPADLKLFHHYTISTFKTMRDEEGDPQDLWQKHIPLWGMEFPPILHLILALSALHMGYEQPEERQRHIEEADNHFTFGVRSVTSVISQLNADNCQKIYMSACLICFIYFGRGPRPGEYLIFSDNGPAEWGVLMHGVKMTVSSHHEKVFSGLLEPAGEKLEFELTPAMRIELHEHTVHLQAVQRLIEESVLDVTERELHIAAISDLFKILDELYERVSGGKTGISLMDVLIGWLYRRPEEYVHRFERKEPRAMIILAYWTVLLKYMETTWFMEGWTAHVLSGIEAFLHGDYRPWIEWPLMKGRSA